MHWSVTVPDSVEKIMSKSLAYLELKSVVFADNSKLRYIGPSAFAGNAIVHIEIPAEVEIIDENCFSFCSLRTVTFDSTANLRRLGDRVFLNCWLMAIHIPAGVVAIGCECFRGCKQLKTVCFDDCGELLVIGAEAFAKTGIREISIPPTVLDIGSRCFSQCYRLSKLSFGPQSQLLAFGTGICSGTKVKEIEIPAHVEVIPDEAFAGTKLSTVSFEEGTRLRRIGKAAFKKTRIVTFSLPDSVELIADECFCDCTKLSSFCISESSKLRSIGRGAFKKANIQRGILIPRHVTCIPANCFEDSYCEVSFAHDSTLQVISYRAFAGNSGQRFDIPSSVEIIEDQAFISRDKPTRVIVFGSCAQISYIGRRAFGDHDSLVIDIHTAVNQLTIMPGAFGYNHQLQITLPTTMTSIPRKCFAFSSCDIVLPPQSLLSTIQNKAFQHCSVSIHLPSSFEMFDIGALNNCQLRDLSLGENQYYSCESGLLIDKRHRAILSSMKDVTSITVPAYIEEIPDKSFLCSNVQYVHFESDTRLKRIGKGAFDSSQLCHIIIPRTVEFIGQCCFRSCDIREFMIDTHNPNYYFEDGIIYNGEGDTCIICIQTKSSLAIPDRVEVIGPGCFSCQVGMSDITFSDSSRLRLISELAFEHIQDVHLVLPPSLEYIAPNAFDRAMNVSIDLANQQFISKNGFLFNKTHIFGVFPGETISELVIPAFVTSIADRCFQFQTHLQSIACEEGSCLAHIGKKSFWHTFLPSFTVPASVKVIDDKCFAKMWSIMGVSITFANNSKLERIGVRAFAESPLTHGTISLPDTVVEIGYQAFGNYINIDKSHKFFAIDGQTGLLLCNKALTYCMAVLDPNIRSITFPDTIEAIEEKTFFEYRSLEDILFSSNSRITRIGRKAFYRTSLFEVYLPNDTVDIGVKAFDSYCKLRYKGEIPDHHQNTVDESTTNR